MIAYPYSNISLWGPARWHYAYRHWYAPDCALTALFYGNRRYSRNYRQVMEMQRQLGFDLDKTPFVPVKHHLAHASSAYHLSGFEEKTAILEYLVMEDILIKKKP